MSAHKVDVSEESGAAECFMCGTVVPSVAEWRKHLVEGCPGMNVPPSEMDAAYERARAMITPAGELHEWKRIAYEALDLLDDLKPGTPEVLALYDRMIRLIGGKGRSEG